MISVSGSGVQHLRLECKANQRVAFGTGRV